MPDRKLWNGMTQNERILKMLLKHRRDGITAVDFDLPDVIDGGPAISRVAARVGELKAEGHKIVGGGRRAKCKIYLHRGFDTIGAQQHADRLTRPPRPNRAGEIAQPPQLFADGGPRRPAGPYDELDEAA